MIKQSVTRMQSLARLAKERLVNASRTQLSKQVLMQTNHHHHHVHTPDEEGGDGDASPSMSWRLVVSTHSRVYEHSHSFTTCLWTQTLPFIYQMFLNTNSIIHLPHVYEHKQHHSFITCLWTQTASFIYHMSMNTNSIIHLPHVYEHKQHHSFTTCPWTQPMSFIYHMFLNTTSTPELQSPHRDGMWQLYHCIYQVLLPKWITAC